MSENITATTADHAPESGTDLALRTDPAAVIESLKAGNANVYSSIELNTLGDKIAVLKALTDAKSVDENLGAPIALVDFVVQAIEVRDNESGQLEPAARVILIDADGTAYAAVSSGLVRSLETITGVAGMPSKWVDDKGKKTPINCTVVQERARSGYKFFTVKLV